MTLRENGSLKSISDTKMDQERHNTGTRNEGENLMVRKTQGDLLQKLRQLRQWQQQQQEHLLQNKEKKLGLIKEQEKRLQAVQEYQKRILAQNGNLGGLSSGVKKITIQGFQNSMGNTPLFHMQSHGSGLQEIPAGRHLSGLEPENVNPTMSMNEVGSSGLMPPSRTVPQTEGQPLKGLQLGDYNSNVNTMLTNTSDSAGLIPPPSTVLLSPKHFQTAHNPMLLTQKIHLPVSSDEELSQFTESEGSGSIGDIDGIRPIEDSVIEDSASEISLEDDNISDFHASNEVEDDNLSDVSYGHLDKDFDGDNTLIDDNQEDEQMYIVDKEDLRVNTKPSFDDIPIKPGLGTQTKTFDELLDKQLQAENGKLPAKQDVQPSRVPLKRSFLRKGEGIARFGLQAKKGGSKTIKKQQVLEKMENVDIRNKMNEQKVPVTRKIAVNKLSSSISQDNVGQGSVLQQQKQSSSLESQLSSRVIGPYSSIDVAMETYLEKMIASESDGVGHGFRKMVPLASVSEDSFQERMKRWDEIDIVEKQELNEFELLEEAAANCSLSSNSSTVLHILGKKKTQAKLDSNNNMPGVVQQWRHTGQGREDINVSDSRMFDARNSRVVQERLNVMEHHGDDEAPVDDMGDIEMDSSANNTLTKDNSEDENENEDTLKAVDIISVQSSLALSAGFNDSNAWDDHDVLDSSDVNDDLIISLNTSTPEEKGHVRATQRKSPHASSTPPTSALVTKLFPQLKPKVNEQPKIDKEQHTKLKQSPTPSTVSVHKQSPSAPVINSNNPHDGVGQVMSNAVREKLQELEKEIEKFREENTALHRLREEREKVLQELQRERSLFESYKTEELQRLEKFKAEEERRLRRDKRVFEQYQKASRALPDKKEREEITALKNKITELQEDMKLRESRWSAAATRYKDRIGSLEKENKEMKEEVKLLEKQNLELHHKDQHKAREYQQYKAFEKRKLTKSEEIPSKSVISRTVSQSSSTNEDEHEDFIKENEKLKTPSNSPLVTHQESNKQSNVNGDKHAEKKDVSPAEKDEAKQHSTSTETQQVTKPSTSGAHSETKRSPRLKECGSSKSVNKTSSSKSVRFKDNDTTEDDQPELLPKEICHSDGKREVVNGDGSRVVTFSNGTRKEISADGFSVIVTFFNGDVKQIMPDEREVYYYAEAQTTHTTYPDGMQVLQFPSNQIEKHYPDGTKEIIFPDQTVKYFYQSGAEECVFTDGTVERINGDGDRTVEFPNGQRETYTKLFKKREYPDGTVKTVYTDGRQETRYPSGRLRVKDGEGRLLVDTAEQKHTHQQAIS